MTEGLVLGMEASDPQLEACERWADETTESIAFGGAKYGGKSFLGANLIFSDALTYPETAYFIAREKLNDLRKHTTISISEVFQGWEIKQDDYMRFNGMDNYYDLHNGSVVFFVEARELPRDPMFERFGSAQYTRGWIEEGGELADKAIENLDATVGRKNNLKYGLKRKTLITCNPKKNLLYRKYYKPWREGTLPSNLAFIQAKATDNVWGSPDYIKMLSEISDPVMRARLWDGDWDYEDDPMGMFPFDAVMDLWSNEHVPGGEPAITADIGYIGTNPDSTIIGLWSGWRLEHITRLKGSDTVNTAAVIKDMTVREKVPMSSVVVDATGIGAGVVDQLRCIPFLGGRSPVGAQKGLIHFANLRAQCYYHSAEIVKAREAYIAVETDKEQFQEEFAATRKANKNDDLKFQVIPKDEISKRLSGRSPDRADMFSMRAYLDLVPTGRMMDTIREGREAHANRVRFNPKPKPSNLFGGR